MSSAVAKLPPVARSVPAHLLVCGPFAALEPEFLATVAGLKRTDPLRPVPILVGSNLLAVYLRRRAAAELGAVANLRFLTFLDLAREIAPADDDRPPLPPLGEALLARRALATTAEAAAFGILRNRSSLAAVVVSTADDLRDAGIPPGTLPGLLRGSSRFEDRRAQLSALAAILVVFEESRRRYRDPTGLLERAAAVSIPVSPEPLLVYGLYDLGGLRESLLRSVAASRPIHAFVPDDGQEDPETPRLARSRLFETLLGTPARMLPAPPLPATRIVVAPTDGAEARETVREILRASDEGIPLHRMAILVRSPERQEPALTAELDLRGIPFFRPAGTGFSRSPLGRAAQALVRLVAEDFPADALRELLDFLETLDVFPRLGLAGTSSARLGAALAGIAFSQGRHHLERKLAAALDRLRRPLSPADDPDGHFARRRAREREEIEALGKAVTAVMTALPAGEAAPWSDWSERLRLAFETLFSGAPGSDRFRPALEAIVGLAAVDGSAPVEISAVRSHLSDALDLSPVLHGRFERDGVALLSAVSARGLLFDAVFVPGLVEQSFPSPLRPDPLLFDAERQRIAASAARPLRGRADERSLREERFLFFLARTSATRRLTLLASARDVTTDRPRLLSPYLFDVADGKAREALRARELGRRETELPREVMWLPAGRLVLDGPPLDGEEALRRGLLRDAGLKKALPLTAAAVAAALARSAARQTPLFTEYEGNVGREARRLRLRGRMVSASRLEQLATCAYRSFLDVALGLEAAESADDETPFFGLDPLALGSALHAALRKVTRQLIAEKETFAALTETRIRATARRAATEEVEELLASLGTDPPPVLVEVERRRLEDLLRALLTALSESPGDLPPAGAEVRFGPPVLGAGDPDEDPDLSTDEPAKVPNLRLDVSLVGRIDRLDRQGTRARVVDYKTGSPAPFGEENGRNHLVAGGERLQLSVYALAARQLGGREIGSEYVFVRFFKRRPKVTVTAFDPGQTEEAIRGLEAVLNLADAAISAGLYLPKTDSLRYDDPCGFCDFAAVCGPGHARLYRAKWEGEERAGSALPLAAMRKIP